MLFYKQKEPCKECFAKTSFEFVRKLGSGSFGAVFLVKDNEERNLKGEKNKWFNKEFAMKQVGEEQGSKEALEAFNEGLQTYHPHCIEFVYSFWFQHDNDSKGHTFLLMELCYEKTLDKWIERNRTEPDYPLIDMKKWIWQILSALEWLNEKGVIHRDLKPDNVFFATDEDYKLGGNLKIGDFGMIFRSIESNKPGGEFRQTCTQDGADYYTAPEVLNGDPYNASADIFSLGIIAADLIQHVYLAHFEKANDTFRKYEFPEILQKQPETVKDFLKKATAPSKDRPLAKELIKHVFFSDCEVSDRIPDYKLIDTLQRLEDNHPLSENELQIRENAWSQTPFSVTFCDGTVARLGVSEEAIEELLRHELPKENLFDAATRILTTVVSLTGSSDFSLKNTTRMPYYEKYLEDLYYYAERMKDQKLVFFGLESTSFEKLKENYVNGHVKLIPNLEVWMMDGCKDFMRSVFGNNGKIQFTNGNAPLHYMLRNDVLEYVNGVQTPVDVEELCFSKETMDLILKSPIPIESEPLKRRIKTIGSFISKGQMPEVTWSNYNVDVIQSYYRLLLAACVFIRVKLERDLILDISFSDNIKNVIWAPDGLYDFLLPTFSLFVQEPVQNWESWTEIFTVPLCKRTYAYLEPGELDPFESKLSQVAVVAAKDYLLELNDGSTVSIGSPTYAMLMIASQDVNKEGWPQVLLRIITVQNVLTHSNSFLSADGSFPKGYPQYSLDTLVKYHNALMHYACKLQDQKIVLFGLEEESFDRIKEKRHVKMIPSIEVWMMDGCKEYLSEQIKSKGKIVFSNEDEKLEWIPRREELINLRGNFNEAHIHVEHDVIGNISRRLKVMVNAQVPETAKQVTERIVSISTYLSGPTQLDSSGRAQNIAMDHGRGIEDLKNYLRLLIGASNFSIEKSEGGNGPEFFFNDDMETLATSVKKASVHLPTFKVFLEEPIEHWESWAEVSWKLWNTKNKVTNNKKKGDDKKKEGHTTLDANDVSYSQAELMKCFNAIYEVP